MRPVRAPLRIHRMLTSHFGFGFSEGYYLGLFCAGPLRVGVHFDREASGFLVYLSVYYPVDASGCRINPHELLVLAPDGSLGCIPDRDEVDRFWCFSAKADVEHELSRFIELWFARLCNPELMIPVYKFLLGESEAIPSEFPLAAFKWSQRKPTANRLLALACYLACSGDFVGARHAITSIPHDLVGWAERKVLADCTKEIIVQPVEGIEYLKSIGAKI